MVGDFAEGCKQIQPILGVPAVTLGGFSADRAGDNIGIFTESTNVFLRFADDALPLDEKIAFAETLMPIGASSATALAPPAGAFVAEIERACGPTPP